MSNKRQTINEMNFKLHEFSVGNTRERVSDTVQMANIKCFQFPSIHWNFMYSHFSTILSNNPFYNSVSRIKSEFAYGTMDFATGFCHQQVDLCLLANIYANNYSIPLLSIANARMQMRVHKFEWLTFTHFDIQSR